MARMDEWINAEEAGRILRVSSRMVYRYAEGDSPHIRKMQAGRRILFNRADVEAFAEETAAENRPKTQPDTVRADELMTMVREQQAQLLAAAAQLGEMKERLAVRLLPEQADELKDRIHTLEREKDRLEWDNQRLVERLAALEAQQPEEPAALQRPKQSWIDRLLGR